jgi:L-iditol 2-dehydrogenase
VTDTAMLAARLHGRADLRVEQVPRPPRPGPGQALLRVTAVGICGSDLHTYQDARIGDTALRSPLILGHEFAGVVEAVGSDALDGHFQPLHVGARVAVDPAQPCGRCEMCELGHPNLCWRLHFCGLYPDDGSLCQWMLVPARTCFPVSDALDDVAAAMLEPLGIAMHAVDLARIRVANSVAVVGAGPIGLLIVQVARLAGAGAIFVSDRLVWRLDLARRLGAMPFDYDETDPVRAVIDATGGRGVDVAIEAAWSDHSVQQAAEMARMGGRLVLVGIPGDDRLALKHSTARRKGLTIRMARRMQHTYPRTISLAERGAVDLHGLISHRFALEQAPAAFALNAAYQDQVVKVMIDV